jgi:hypothetical protein
VLRISLRRAAPLTLLVLLAAASPASATVTTSSVTTPSDPAFPVADVNLPGNTTVSGTSDGTTGDHVDIRCYYGAASFVTFADNVAVGASGNFSKTDFTFVLEGGLSPLPSCVLRAVPHGDTSDQRPESASSFSGPFVGNGSRYMYTVAGGKNDGTQYDFDSEQSAQRGFVILNAASDLGIDFGGLFTQPLLDPSPGIWDGNAYFYFKPSFGPARSELRLDGVDAYGPASAFYAFPEAKDDPGFPALGYSESLNAANGNLTIDDFEPFVTCSPAPGTYPPTSASCSSFASAGVMLHRTLTTTNAGRVIGIVDRWSSTDGRSHLLDVLYENDQESDDAGGIGAGDDGAYVFPWRDGAYTGYATDATFGGPGAAPASFFYKTRADVPASGDDLHPFGAVTFQSAPEEFHFLRGTSDVSYSALTMRYTRTIPATGECALRFAYSDDFTEASVDSFAAGAQSALGGATDICQPPPPPAPGGGGGTTPPPTKPGVRVKVKRTFKIRDAIKHGIPETVTCDKPCAIVADLQFDSRTTKQLHITKFVRTGRGRGRLTAAGNVKVVVKLTKKVGRALRHAKRVKARIRTTATGAGGKTVVTSKLTLRR